MRGIAADAGIDPALVVRYFGSKEKLFEEALAASLDVAPLTAVPRAEFGKAVVAYFLADGDGARNPLPMMVLAAADPAARAVTVRLLASHVLAPIGAWIGTDDGAARAARILAICSGFFTYRLLLPIGYFADDLDPATRTWLERALQAAVSD